MSIRSHLSPCLSQHESLASHILHSFPSPSPSELPYPRQFSWHSEGEVMTRLALRRLSRPSPTDYAFGWITFWISIFLIGIVTAFIGDIASHLGCTIGLKDSVNAIAFVALGTSVPGNLSCRPELLHARRPPSDVVQPFTSQTFIHSLIWFHLKVSQNSDIGQQTWGGSDSDSLAGLCDSSFGFNSESNNNTRPHVRAPSCTTSRRTSSYLTHSRSHASSITAST